MLKETLKDNVQANTYALLFYYFKMPRHDFFNLSMI